jgi:hypothetical protein
MCTLFFDLWSARAVGRIVCHLFEMHGRNGAKCSAIFAQQFDTGRRNDEEAGSMIVRMFAPDYDALLNKRGQFAEYRRARSDIQQKQPFQGQRFSLLFRISDLDDEIEIDDGLEERQLQSLKLPYFLQSGK